MADAGETSALWFYSSTILFPLIMAVMWCNWHSIAAAVIDYLKDLVTRCLAALVFTEPLSTGIPGAWPVLSPSPSPSPYLDAVDVDVVKKRRKAPVVKSQDTSARDSEILQLTAQVHILSHELEKQTTSTIPQDTSGLDSENQQLKEQVHYLNHELKKRESTTNPQDTSALDTKIRSLTEENQTLTEEVTRLNTTTQPQDTSVLEAENLRLTQENQSYIAEINRLNTTPQSQDTNALVNENLKLRGQIQSLALEVNRGIQSQHDEAAGVREAYESEIQKMKTLAQQNHDQEVAQLIHDHDAQVNNLRATIEELNTNVNKLMSDAEDRDTLFNQLHHEASIRNATTNELINEANKLRSYAEGRDTLVNQLNHEVSNHDTMITDLKREASELRNHVSSRDATINELRSEAIELKNNAEARNTVLHQPRTPDSIMSDHDTLVNTPTPTVLRDAIQKRIDDEDVQLDLLTNMSNMELDVMEVVGMEVVRDEEVPVKVRKIAGPMVRIRNVVGAIVQKRNMNDDCFEHISKRKNHVLDNDEDVDGSNPPVQQQIIEHEPKHLLQGPSRFQVKSGEATLMKYNREIIRLRENLHIALDKSGHELVSPEIEVNSPSYICLRREKYQRKGESTDWQERKTYESRKKPWKVTEWEFDPERDDRVRLNEKILGDPVAKKLLADKRKLQKEKEHLENKANEYSREMCMQRSNTVSVKDATALQNDQKRLQKERDEAIKKYDAREKAYKAATDSYYLQRDNITAKREEARRLKRDVEEKDGIIKELRRLARLQA